MLITGALTDARQRQEVEALVRADKWIQAAGPGDIIKAVPETYLLGDRAVYVDAFLAAKGALSPDGMIPEAGAETARRALGLKDVAGTQAPDGTRLLGLPHDALGLVLCTLPTEARRAARAACRALHRARCHQARLVLRDAPPPHGGGWPAWACGEDGTDVCRPDVLLVAFARPLPCLREISRRVAPARRVCLGRGSGLAEAHAALQLWPDPAVEVEVVSTAPYGLRVPPVSPRLRLRDVTVCDDDPATLRAIAAWRPACVTFRAPAGLGAVSGAVAAYGDGSLVVHAHPGDADAALRLAPGARVAAVCWTGGPADGLAHLLECGGPMLVHLLIRRVAHHVDERLGRRILHHQDGVPPRPRPVADDVVRVGAGVADLAAHPVQVRLDLTRVGQVVRESLTGVELQQVDHHHRGVGGQVVERLQVDGTVVDGVGHQVSWSVSADRRRGRDSRRSYAIRR